MAQRLILLKGPANLGDYIAAAEYLAVTSKPTFVCFLLVDNDYDFSWNPRAGGYHFTRTPTGLELIRTDKAPRSAIVNIALQSSLVRYLVFQLTLVDRLRARLRTKDSTAKAFGRSSDDARLMLSELRRRTALPHKNIVFIIDPDRKALYGTAMRAHRDIDFSPT